MSNILWLGKFDDLVDAIDSPDFTMSDDLSSCITTHTYLHLISFSARLPRLDSIHAPRLSLTSSAMPLSPNVEIGRAATNRLRKNAVVMPEAETPVSFLLGNAQSRLLQLYSRQSYSKVSNRSQLLTIQYLKTYVFLYSVQ